jgi:hypothetical protein
MDVSKEWIRFGRRSPGWARRKDLILTNRPGCRVSAPTHAFTVRQRDATVASRASKCARIRGTSLFYQRIG